MSPAAASQKYYIVMGLILLFPWTILVLTGLMAFLTRRRT